MSLGSPDLEREWSREQESRIPITGIAVVGYLLVLLYGFRLLRSCAPRVGWVRRLDRRWTDLWMR
ncbi:MAG TPA: hypothetical protein VHG35_18175 [Gemmatimonadales bacterium]|nr:hypothetical protein [Gemmatimonadales bacterium]